MGTARKGVPQRTMHPAHTVCATSARRYETRRDRAANFTLSVGCENPTPHIQDRPPFFPRLDLHIHLTFPFIQLPIIEIVLDTTAANLQNTTPPVM